MQVQEKLMTAEEFAMLPSSDTPQDLVKGVVVNMAIPKPLHGIVQCRLGASIGDFVDRQKLGLVTFTSGYILARNPDTVRGPDIAFISFAQLPNPDLDAYCPIAPDLMVEIVSPNDTFAELLQKLDEYFQAGTRLIWVVHPDKQQVYAYRSLTSLKIIASDGTLDGGDVLPGFTLTVRDLFDRL